MFTADRATAGRSPAGSAQGGEVALVTGAARGLGAAIVDALVRDGFAVFAADIKPMPAESHRGRVSAVSLDVTDREQWEQIVAEIRRRHGRIDALVNNAGIQSATDITDASLEEYHRTVDVNQHGVFHGMAAVLPHMVAARHGVVVNVASTNGLRGMAGTTAYTASKHAVVGMTRAAALDVAASRVRVVTVCPGAMRTEMLADFFGEQQLSAFAQKVPLGRLAEPSEVAEVVAFLVSARGSYCTGTEFIADGGLSTGYG